MNIKEKDWSIPEDGKIDVPDHLMPLFNSIANQMRLHTISGKEEVLTIAHIVQHAEKFFQFYWVGLGGIYAKTRVSELKQEAGKAGCTYGDTDMDSVSVAFGYNLCLENVKSILDEQSKKILSKNE